MCSTQPKRECCYICTLSSADEEGGTEVCAQMLHSPATYSTFVALWNRFNLQDRDLKLHNKIVEKQTFSTKSTKVCQYCNRGVPTSGLLGSCYAEASRETSAIYPEVVWKSGASPAKLLLEQFKSQNQESTTSTEPHHQHPQQRYIPILAICIDITSNCILGTPFIPCSLSKSILPTSF